MAFKHYLNFLSLPSVGTIEISEPIGFDGASYKIKQDDKRFGRDIIIANEDTELTFTRDYFEQIQIIQTLPSGETFNYASQGFDYLLDIFQNDGWEGKVEYIIEKDNTTFVTGVFSYYTSIVEFDNIKVKIIQNTNREILRRLEDTDIDAFNNKALDGRDIDPCETTNILLKAKPAIQIGNWSYGIDDVTYLKRSDFAGIYFYFNYTNEIIDSTLENELSFIQGFSMNPRLDFRYLYAANGFSNVTVNITNLDVRLLPVFDVSKISLKWEIYDGTSAPSIDGGTIAMATSSTPFLSDYTLNIEEIPRSYYLSIYFQITGEAVSGDPIIVEYHSMDIKITGTSTSIDTVVKGIRLIDLIKHNVKSIVDMPVIAPEYDIDGEHYDNFAFNGLLLGQITDKPFYNQFKDLMNIPMETCSDYQINPDSIEILPYSDYYSNIELAVFDELPSFDANSMFSKEYCLKNAEFKYNKSSNENTTNGENSIDDVHTETQKYITDSVDGSLKVEIKHIRSAFLLEQARRRVFENQETTSLQNDDSLFILKCIELAPGSEGSFGSVLLQQIDTDTNNLKILNNNLDGDGLDFNWTLLGFSVGSTLFIDIGTNSGEYVVISITSTVLELDKVTGVPTFTGEEYIKLRWLYTDVLWTNQTNEGFDIIEGVANADKYSNLDYSWGRNIQRWYPYLATATKFKPNDVIKTTSFKVNGNLVTKKETEAESIADSADIINSEIANQKILNPFLHTIKVYADFNTVTQLIEDIRDIKGYVTVNLNDGRMIKGYVKEMDYTWITEELDLVIEEKFISDFMEIVLVTNLDTTTTTTITLPGYPTKNDLKSFQINNIFVTLYNSVDNELYPPTRFTNIKINGVKYTDIIEFSDALTELINAQNE